MALNPHSDELTHNAFLTDRELNDLETFLNKKQEHETEKHVKINIRSSMINSTNRLPLKEIEDDDPDYISNLIVMNDMKEKENRSIFSVDPGLTLDHENVFSRYDMPFFTNKVTFRDKFDFGNMMISSREKEEKAKMEESEIEDIPICKDKEMVKILQIIRKVISLG